MLVYVLLFNARTENEGIHTLKEQDKNYVLMFEDEDDATRFGLMLEAQDFPPATVEQFEVEEIEEFCDSAGYECRLVPEGTLAMPPEQSVDKPDWDPNADPDTLPPLSAESGAPDNDLSQAELDRIRKQLENLL